MFCNIWERNSQVFYSSLAYFSLINGEIIFIYYIDIENKLINFTNVLFIWGKITIHTAIPNYLPTTSITLEASIRYLRNT